MSRLCALHERTMVWTKLLPCQRALCTSKVHTPIQRVAIRARQKCTNSKYRCNGNKPALQNTKPGTRCHRLPVHHAYNPIQGAPFRAPQKCYISKYRCSGIKICATAHKNPLHGVMDFLCAMEKVKIVSYWSGCFFLYGSRIQSASTV